MKKIVLFLVIGFLSIRSLACDCEGYNAAGSSGNVGVFDFGAKGIEMLTNDGCDRPFTGGWFTEVIFDDQITINWQSLYAPGYGYGDDWLAAQENDKIDLQQLTDYLIAGGYFFKSVSIKFLFEVPSNLFCGYLQGEYESYLYKLKVYYGGDMKFKLNTVCSGLEYQFTDIMDVNPAVTTGAATYIDQTVTTSSGEQFSGATITFGQPTGSTTSVIWEGVHAGSGLLVRRRYQTDIYSVGNIQFTSLPTNLNAQSADVSFNTMCTYTQGPGYYLEASMTDGVYHTFNGPLEYFFSANFAGDGTHQLIVRSSHYGCKSNWIDTTIYVTPIVSNFGSPTVDLNLTFGSGESGLAVKKAFPATVSGTFPNTVTYPAGVNTIGRFHFVCEGDTYTFYVNNPNASLFYDWFVFYNGSYDSIGEGSTIQYTVPLNPSLNVYQGVSSNPFPIVNNDMPWYIESGSGKTVYGGDVITLFVRARNVVGDVSSFRRVYLGNTPKPEISNQNEVCYDPGNLNLVVNSVSPSYLNLIMLSDIRSGRWNVDADPTWEILGDTVSYNLGNSNKVNYLIGESLDTTKMYMWNNGWNVTIEPSADIVCYSGSELIPLVIKPQVTGSFNQVGVVGAGTAVLGVAGGSYFDPASDSITWHWSDDSNVWGGDSCWHYLNDLGNHGVIISVIDSMGCVNDVDYSGYWQLLGYLGVDEYKEDSLLLFPNPSHGHINVSGAVGDEYEIYSLLGEKVKSGVHDSLALDLVDMNGTYIYINRTKNKYIKFVII